MKSHMTKREGRITEFHFGSCTIFGNLENFPSRRVNYKISSEVSTHLYVLFGSHAP